MEAAALGNLSAYSFGRSLWHPAELVATAARLGYGVVGLADWQGFFGAVEFVQAGQKHGIRTVFGCRLQLSGAGEVHLMPRNAAGYAAINRLLTDQADSGLAKPPGAVGEAAWSDWWARAGEDVAVIVPLARPGEEREGDWRQRLAHWERHRANLYWGLGGWCTPAERRAQRNFFTAHRGSGYRWVALTHAARRPDQSGHALAMLEAVHDGSMWGRGGVVIDRTDGVLETAADWRARWSGVPEVRAGMEDLLAGLTFTYPLGQLFLPHRRPVRRVGSAPPEERPETPEDQSDDALLAELCREGLRERYGSGYPWPEKPSAAEREARLEGELRVVERTGYAGYFLLFYEVVLLCRERDVSLLARGSAAGSLICYALGVSNVCPFRFGLHFERFLNEERLLCSKLPDIDLDLPWDRRDEIMSLVYERYGPERVAMVGGFSTFQARMAVAEVGKVLGCSEREVRRWTAMIPPGGIAKLRTRQNLLPELRDHRESAEFQTVLTIAEALDGLPRHPMMHPCGLVIADRPLTEFTPLLSSRKGDAWRTEDGATRYFQMTQMGMDAIEDLGLLKLDLLGQAGLSVIRDTLANIRENRAERPGRRTRAPVLDRLRYDDPRIFKMIAEGGARGIFHIESPAMTSLLQLCRCADLDCLVATVSVIRPGAANEDKKTKFARRYLGMEPPQYVHPDLEPILGDTFGLLVYEEHIIRVAHQWAGLDLGRADVLRRILVRKATRDLAVLEKEFFAAARDRKGRQEGDIRTIWEMLVQFSGYMFNKAHGAAYAVEAYHAAWLKFHYPGCYLAAVLENERGFYQPLVYVLELRQQGFRLEAPRVTRLTVHYRCRGDRVEVPLRAMRNLTRRLVERWEEALAHRPFRSMEDFVQRLDPTPEDLIRLARAGALADFYPNRYAAVRAAHAFAGRPRDRSGDLFGGSLDPVRVEGPFPPENPVEMAAWEKEIFGYPLTVDPLAIALRGIDRTGCLPLARLPEWEGREVEVAGLVVAVRNLLNRKGQPMRFFSLADETAIREVTVFTPCWQRHGYGMARREAFRLRVRVEADATSSGIQLIMLDLVDDQGGAVTEGPSRAVGQGSAGG